MPVSRLGNYIRERRQDLGLSQQDLAERIGTGVTQAEVSRLERGAVTFPRRSRLDALAVALEVSLGTLLIQAGWLESDEAALVEVFAPAGPRQDAPSTEAMLTDVARLRDTLVAAIARIEALTQVIATTTAASAPESIFPADPRKPWEVSATPEA